MQRRQRDETGSIWQALGTAAVLTVVVAFPALAQSALRLRPCRPPSSPSLSRQLRADSFEADRVHRSRCHGASVDADREARFHPGRDRLTRRRRRGSLRRAGYFDAGLAPGLRASGCGLRKVGLAGATFLSAFGFFASRLPCCLSPLPMIVHPAGMLSAAIADGRATLLCIRLCRRNM
jgi:hypothetical protein